MDKISVLVLIAISYCIFLLVQYINLMEKHMSIDIFNDILYFL